MFLASGSVIHALGGEQDIRKMGGLGKHMKLTGTTALIATLAIAGVPFLSGFFSKDAILTHVFTSELIAGKGNVVLYVILLVTAAMTAFYMFRWYYVVFAGEERLTTDAKAHLHESPTVMTAPLLVLAFFSIFAGYFGLPEFMFPNAFAGWIERSVDVHAGFHHLSIGIEWLMILLSVVAAGLGLAIGYWVYALQKGQPAQAFSTNVLARWSLAGVGFDSLYRMLFIRSSEGLAASLDNADKNLVDNGLNGGAKGIGLIAKAVTSLQSGYVRAYALAMFLGIFIFILAVAFSGGPA